MTSPNKTEDVISRYKGLLNLIPNYSSMSLKMRRGTNLQKYQHKVHMSPSGPSILPPEVPIPSPMVNTTQPPRVDKGGPSSDLISRGKKNPWPRYALPAQCQKIHEANSVTHQISGVAHEYRHLVKGPEKKIWEISFANELG